MESIGHNFLAECKELREIDLRGMLKVKSIGDNFLFGCKGLEMIICEEKTKKMIKAKCPELYDKVLIKTRDNKINIKTKIKIEI